ncbi:MAG TPA: hypothetical protein VKS21_05040, partial [Spirochaetota bacterium]|nr:hypothetical protein [Spirochaetota bacterium]
MINRGRLLLNGYFEKKHRSPVTAAFIVILAAGALYSFLGQLFISMIFFLRGFMTELQQQLKHSDFFTVYKILIEDNKYFFMITTSVFQ